MSDLSMNIIYNTRHNLIKFYIFIFHKNAFLRFYRYQKYKFNKLLTNTFINHFKYINDNIREEDHLLHILRHKNN